MFVRPYKRSLVLYNDFVGVCVCVEGYVCECMCECAYVCVGRGVFVCLRVCVCERVNLLMCVFVCVNVCVVYSLPTCALPPYTVMH